MSAKYKHAKLLNALHDMQKSVAYAVRRDVLSQAEAVIADYERVESLQQARIAQLEEELRRSVTNAEATTRTISIDYAIALQRAVEYHCRGQQVPEWIAHDCPRHAEKLNDCLCRPTGATK